MNPKKLRRPIRFLILAGLAIVVALYMRTRPEKITMQDDDRSMWPAYDPGDSLAARRVDEDFEFRRGMDVLYAIEGKGFLGRIRALPGDRVEEKGGFLFVNGEPIKPKPIPGKAPLGVVPDGKLCILNVYPDPSYSDSRQLGFIPVTQVEAIILNKIR